MSDDPVALWEANADTWTRCVRAGYDYYRDRLNSPAFFAMLPPVAGSTGLDIGCGEGENTRALARRGARMTAIDVAPTFVGHAAAHEAAEPLGIAYRQADATALPFADAAFDFAAAFMSLMDVADVWRALREAHRILKPGGFLQFTILHPCFVPAHRRVLRDEQGLSYAIEVGGYSEPGADVEEWRFSGAARTEDAPLMRLMYFRHTLSEWFNGVVDAGFAIERVAEPVATPELAAAYPGLQDTRVAPLSLIVRGRKPLGKP